MNCDIESRIKKVMANVFGVNVESITEDDSTDTIEKWTSLGHMNLVIALEEEFGIQFNEQAIIELISYPLVVYTVKEVLETEKVT